MRKSIFILSTICLFIVTLFASCGPTKPEGRGPLYPEDFSKYPSTILIIPSAINAVNKGTKDAFEKYYTGKYIILGGGDVMYKADSKTFEIVNPAYSDTKKFRYLIYCGTFSTIHYDGSNSSGADYYNYHIIDRVTGQRYSSKNRKGLKTLAEAYVKRLETVRAK